MKYVYNFCVYKNNARDGVQFVAAYNSLNDAHKQKRRIEYSGGGCCDVVKKRFRPGAEKPINNSIYNNYKFNIFDLMEG